MIHSKGINPRGTWRRRVREGVLLGAGVLAAAGALSVAISQAGGVWGLILAIGALGFLFYLGGSTRVTPGLLNWGVGLILAALVVSVPFSQRAVSPGVLVEGACLYAAAELGWLAASPPQVLTAPTLVLRGAIVLGGLLVGYLALFGLALPLGGGPEITVLGAAAAVAVFFLLRGRHPRRPARTPRPARK